MLILRRDFKLPGKGYNQKTIYIDSEMLDDIKIKMVKEDGPRKISELVRNVWKEYLEKDFELIGYRNMELNYKKDALKMEKKISPLIPEDLITEIDLKLMDNMKRYRNDKDLSKITYVTLELVKRLYLDEEKVGI